MRPKDSVKWTMSGWKSSSSLAILFLASPENRVTRSAVVPVYGRG